MLIATVATNVMTASPGPIGAETAWTASANRTSPVPSLSRLSPSTIVDSAGGTRSRLNVATTAAGSVADTIAPTMNARSSGRPVARLSTTATMAAEMTTPGTASRARPAEPAPELGDPQPVGGLEHEAGQQDEEDEVRRDVDRREPGCTRDKADEQSRDDERDGVREPEAGARRSQRTRRGPGGPPAARSHRGSRRRSSGRRHRGRRGLTRRPWSV